MDYKLCYSYQSTYISLIFTIRRHSIIEKNQKIYWLIKGGVH